MAGRAVTPMPDAPVLSMRFCTCGYLLEATMPERMYGNYLPEPQDARHWRIHASAV